MARRLGLTLLLPASGFDREGFDALESLYARRALEVWS